MTQAQQKEDGDRIHGVVHANIVTLPELLFEEQARLSTTRRLCCHHIQKMAQAALILVTQNLMPLVTHKPILSLLIPLLGKFSLHVWVSTS
jgi:hypothetical protein